jgi:hypothetical protein
MARIANNSPLNNLRLWLGAIVVLALHWPSSESFAARVEPTIPVNSAYVELHSGPGRGYPVFHTVERGGSVTLMKRRTDWVKVRTDAGVEGWVHRREVEQASGDAGDFYSARDAAMDDFLERRVELGLASGDFDGDRSYTFRAGYRFSEYFMAELALTEVSGTFSSTTLYNANLVMLPFSSWRISPFFSIGTGRFKNDPKDVLVDDQDVDEWAANAAVGVRGYLTRRFMLRGDYRRHVVMTDEEGNDEFSEWTLGFSVFF